MQSRDKCVFCHGETTQRPDPRLPKLRVHACRKCRDYLAKLCGWRPDRKAWVRGAHYIGSDRL